MHHGMVAERLDVHRPPAAPQQYSVLKELNAAKRIANDLAHSACNQLDGEGMYSLSMLEGLIAGAIKKIEAAGVTP